MRVSRSRTRFWQDHLCHVLNPSQREGRSSLRHCVIVCAIVVTVLSGLLYRAMADGGALDSGFGAGGKTATDFAGASEDEAFAVAIQPDGRIVVAGRTHTANQYDYKGALARYNVDGTLDTSFGSGGKVTAVAGSNNGFAVVIQPDGKILTTGYSGVTRYNSNGSLDTSFGSGGATPLLVESRAMSLQPDGKIIVGGYISVSYRRTDFAVGRYNSDGSIDTNFGSSGKITTDIAGGHASIYALAL